MRSKELEKGDWKMRWRITSSIEDLEKGLVFGNFKVINGIPKISTWIGFGKDDLEVDLIDTSKFGEVTKEVIQTLMEKGMVVLSGDRGIGKSTLATYIIWRLLHNKLVDVVVHVNKLIPVDALEINNQIRADNKKYVIIYDPSPIDVYYEPRTMQNIHYDIDGIKTTLNELMDIKNAWKIIVLPNDFYNIISGNEELGNIINDNVITINLKDKAFLRDVIKEYSGYDSVSDELVKRVMKYDSYTLVAKYTGIIMRERRCEAKNADELIRGSVDMVKLFFAHYIWGSILQENTNLARKASVPLIFYTTFGKLSEDVVYMMKAINDGGVWELIDRDRVAKSKLEELIEDDLKPIAKWLSIWHEDLIDETLKDLIGLNGEETRNKYRDHGLKDFIESLDWGYKKLIKRITRPYENLDKEV
jgi:hypothetical protein